MLVMGMEQKQAPKLENVVGSGNGKNIARAFDSKGIAMFDTARQSQATNSARAIGLYRDAIGYLKTELDMETQIEDKLGLTIMLRECYVKLCGEALNAGLLPTVDLPNDSMYYNREISEIDAFLRKHNIDPTITVYAAKQ